MSMADARERAATPPRLSWNAKGKRPQIFDTPAIDHAMSMIMVLAGEFAVLRDRVDSIERLAARRGWNLAEELDGLELDQAALDEREAWRQQFISRLYYLLRKEAEEAERGDTQAAMQAAVKEIQQP